MFGISGEHLLVLGIILLIFGPRRLPELGNTLGKAIRNFKDSLAGIEEAKFRRLEDEQTPKQQISTAQVQKTPTPTIPQEPQSSLHSQKPVAADAQVVEAAHPTSGSNSSDSNSNPSSNNQS